MKFTILGMLIQILCISVLFANNLSAQKNKSLDEVFVSVNFKNENMVNVFKNIESQTSFKFTYFKEDVEGKKVTLRLKKKNLSETLYRLAGQAGIKFRRVNENIQVGIDHGRSKNKTDLVDDTFQDRTITGTVKDEAGLPMPSVTVSVKGTNRGVPTGADGTYRMNVPSSGNAILVFSFIGYETQEVAVGNKSVINVSMAPSSTELDEVVVVGYGTQSRSTLSAAVNTIKAEAFEGLPLTNAVTGLQGRLPGTLITRSSGQPGAEGLDLTIRGLSSVNGGNSPLIIVDGVPGSIVNLNPNDIESVTTLKDGAAAIYGARAANGVLLVTTKKGRLGAPRINVNISGSLRKATGFYDDLSGVQVAEMALEAYDQYGLNTPIAPADFYKRILAGETFSANYANGELGRTLFSTGENWRDLIFDNGFQQNYDLSISGATQNGSYRVSLGFFDEEGILAEGADANKRLNTRMNYQFNVGDRLSIDSRLALVRRSTDRPTANGFGFAPFTWPYFKAFAQDDPTVLSTWGGFVNPLTQLRDQGAINDLNTRAELNFKTDYDIIDGLTLTTQVGANFIFNEQTRFDRTFTVHDPVTGEVFGTRNPNASGSKRLDKTTYSTIISYLTYSKVFGQHDISVTAGGSHEESESEFFSASRRSFPSNDFFSLNLGDGDQQFGNGSASDWAIRSLLGRATYVFDNRFIATANFRYDGSSRFAPETRWGLFWGASLAWKLDQESFIQDLGIFDDLKFRVSLGQTGNQEGIALYDYIQRINVGGQYPFGNGLRVASARLGSLVDPSRTWETLENKNIALDFAFLDGKLSGSFDYFIRTNIDMLIPVTVPSTLGAAAPRGNNGELRTRGYEVQLTWKDEISNNLSYFVNVNLFDSQNEVVDFAGQDTYGIGTVGIREGFPINDIYGYSFDGIIQNQAELDDYLATYGGKGIVPNNIGIGDAKYKDLNGDGRISTFGDDGTDGDVAPIGNITPRYNYGINLGVTYKNFEFSAFLQGVGERDTWIGGELRRPWAVPWRRPDARFYNTTWSPERLNAKFPRQHGNNGISNYNYVLSDNMLVDASYLRLKNVKVAYNIPQSVLEKAGLQKARVYVSGFDLWETSNVPSGYDPETASPTSYPFSRLYTFGLDLTF